MSLKFKYILFIGTIHVIFVLLSYQILEDRKWYFLASEFLILFSLYISYLMYNAFIKPIEMMHSGTDAIADADFTIKYIKTGSHEIDKLVDVYNQMIDRLRIERTSLTEQSYFIQNLIEVTPLGIIILDYDGFISNINPSARLLLQLDSSIIGQQLKPEDSVLIKEILDTDSGVSRMITLHGSNQYKCQVTEVVHQGFKRKFILIDNLSKEILESEKKAYGRIIRMMAHEVNNSMGAINSIIDSVIEFGLQGEGDDELKDSLLIAKDRNINLSQFMANYASILRLPEAAKQKINLTQLLKKSALLFQPIASKNNIELQFDFGLDSVTINGDSVLLEQAISNMIKNAMESIENGGIIKVSCIDKPKMFAISDNGPGIPDEVASKLFTPFYSTKPTGQGVGLMLIREILESHQAKYSLQTNKETGWTSFEVWFP